MLRLNGDLIGFKMKPVSRDEFEAPLNRFSVKSCQIMATEDPRYELFILFFRVSKSTFLFFEKFHRKLIQCSAVGDLEYLK